MTSRHCLTPSNPILLLLVIDVPFHDFLVGLVLLSQLAAAVSYGYVGLVAGEMESGMDTEHFRRC